MTEIQEGPSEVSLSSGSDMEINKKGASKPKEREAHVAAGEALRSACQLVMDDLTRRGQAQVHESSPGLGQQSYQTACYLHDEEYVLLKGVEELSLTALRRLAGLAGRRWPKWHPTDGSGDEELFQRGYIYHTCLSPAEQVLTYEEPQALRGFETIACTVEVPQLGGGPLMPNLLQSLDTNALRRLAATLALPSAGTKASLLKSIRTEFSGRQRTLHRSVLDMSMVLKALRESAYVRLTVVTVRLLAVITALLEVLGGDMQGPSSATFQLATMPKALVLAQAGKLRCAFPGASLSTMPWLLDREEYELIQVGVYGAYLWQLGAQGALKLADLGRLVMQYIDARLDDVKQRLERLERWQASLTCWWQLVSVVWHSVWALERGKEWEQAVITLQWLIRILPSQLQSPSRKAKYLHRLRIDLRHLGRQADFPYMLAEATVEEIDLEGPDSLLSDPIIRLPEPEKVALSGGVPPHIVVNEYDIVDCGAGRAYGRVEAATLDHLGWPGVHDEGGMIRRLMSVLLWRELIDDAVERDTVVSPCQLYPGDLFVEAYIDRATPRVKDRLRKISSMEPDELALEVIRASREVQRSPPLRLVGLRWTHGVEEAGKGRAEKWSIEALAGLAQCMGADIMVKIFRHILSDMGYWGGGMPDLTLRQGQRVRFVEVKGPGDDLSARQRGWIAELMRCGADAEAAYIVEPGKKRPVKRKKRRK